jgi:1-aminocyclopropane-1-carboxylate deaminase/D-cysteine desulfhydrase-like pyridoxal-dependent ACC family enzyme
VESGCSGPLGTFGYVEAAHEILIQIADKGFTDIAIVRPKN